MVCIVIMCIFAHWENKYYTFREDDKFDEQSIYTKSVRYHHV